MIWPLAAHLWTTLPYAPAMLLFSLFFSIPSMLQPEGLCTHCFLSLDVHAAVLSLQSGLREPIQTTLSKTVLLWDFPGGPVVKNPPSNAGDAGSIPGRGAKVPQAAGQLSLCAATTEPLCCKLQSPHALEPARHNYREACAPQCRSHAAK